MTDKQYLEKLGRNIAKIRKSKGISQVNLSYDCDFEKSNMSRIESGKNNSTIITLRKVAKHLKVDMQELLRF